MYSLNRQRSRGDRERITADDRLKNYVLARADADENLSEQARLVVVAALGAPEDLAEVVG